MFFGGAVFVRPLMSMTSTLNTIKAWKYHNFWLSESEASAQMCNFWAVFTDYRAHESPTDIQNIDRPVHAIGIGTAYISFIFPHRTKTNTLLQRTFHDPNLFTNLISLSTLLKKRYSFDTRRFYVLNKFNRKVAYTPLQETYSSQSGL